MRAILVLFFLTLISAVPVAGDAALPVVAVSILPQAEFVEKIAGDRVKALVLVGPGASPHSYEPSPRQMSDLSRAAAWFGIGVEFERALLPKVKSLYPKMRIVDTSAKVVFRNLEAHDDAEATAPGHVDEQGGPDPHIWLGHEAVKIQLTAILEGLKALMPAFASEFTANHTAYVKEIDSVFAQLSTRLAPLRGKTIFVYHPSFGYFLDNFGIQQKAVEVGGKEPTQKTLALLIQQAKAAGARLIFVQKQFSPTAANTVAAAIGGRVVQIDPLARQWLANIRVMGEALASAMEK